ncbi:MAG: ferritin-like domain-containing protein [Pirellulales bacterium]|nr:ferritin-like domain-containing protein [Pirellulales bacterium]
MAASNAEVIAELSRSYEMELETVANYLAHSVNLDGVRAEEIKKSLAADVAGELGHAQQIGQRIKQLGGLVPGSLSLKFDQKMLQPSGDTTNVVDVIKAVIAAEEGAVAQYKKIIRATEGEDYVTQDLCIRLLTDEEAHLIQFRGFLKEYQQS